MNDNPTGVAYGGHGADRRVATENRSRTSRQGDRTRPAEGRPASPRRRLYGTIEAQPGLNIEELASCMGLSRGAVRHHLRRLSARRRIVIHRQGRHRLHFAADVDESRRMAIALLRLGSVRAIVEASMDDPIIRVSHLAEKAGYTPRSIRHGIRILTRAGLADDRRTSTVPGGRRVLLHPEVRVVWASWRADAEHAKGLEPMVRAPSWLFLFHSALADLVATWFS